MAEAEKLLVVFTGGGSGGHVYPLLAVAEALRKRVLALGAPAEFIYMGPKDAYAPLIKARGMDVVNIVSGKVRRYASAANIADVPKFFIGFIQALFELYFIMPDVIFSKGGTGALPVVMAGWFYRIPIIIHESDAHPGLTNLASARFSKKVFVSFARAAQFFNPEKTKVSGAPIRTELLEGRTTRELAKETLGFNPQEPLTVIIGGSQGSTRINEFILTNLVPLIKETQVLHQTGVANFLEAQKLSHAALEGLNVKNRYQPVNYFESNLVTALTAADVVIARAGASIFEIASFGIPSILIPLAESANGHQRMNAYELANAGGAIVIEEPNLLPGIFFGQLKSLLSNPDLRAKMGAAAQKFFTGGASEMIADEILETAA